MRRIRPSRIAPPPRLLDRAGTRPENFDCDMPPRRWNLMSMDRLTIFWQIGLVFFNGLRQKTLIFTRVDGLTSWMAENHRVFSIHKQDYF